jgi:Kef-type K+ transport system membrane component KefB/nucleotide-binding universal stress UspA family protein
MLEHPGGALMAFHLPEVPLTDAGWLFALLMVLVLVVPMVAERVRVPGIVALVLAGTLVGPTGLGLVEREGMIETLGTVGLLYLMFVAGLELDLDDFAANRRDAVGFGALTFLLPMIIGTAVIALMGFELLAAILLASCWASHTLLTYPTFRRFGTQSNRAVATSVGATIITDTAALIVLVVVARAYGGDLGVGFWLTLLPSLVVLLGLILWALPRLARWFFAGPGQDRTLRFLFIMVALFTASALAELAGIEAIIGAFLAGLALNRLVPNSSVLMDRVEFLGAALLIPLFLLSVGMLIDPAVLADPATIAVAGGFVAVALGAKLLAAVGAGKAFGYSRTEIGAMFSLSSAQAAATLAAVIIGLQVGLITAETVNAVVLVILVTCIVSSWGANRWAPRLERPGASRALGQTVVVPVANPASREPLVRLAAQMARRDSGFVVPLTVVDAEAADDEMEFLGEATEAAERIALANGAEAAGQVRIDRTPTSGILHTLVERRGSLLVLGWSGETGRGGALFSTLIDRVLSEAPVPMLIARLRDEQPTGVLLSISESNATPVGRAGLELALQTVLRLSKRDSLPVRVISNIDDASVRARVQEVLEVDVEIDQRRRSIAVRARAEPGDIVIVPVKPAAQALRGVASRIARAIPEHSIVMPLDVSGFAVSRVRDEQGDGADRDSQDVEITLPVDALASRTTPGDPAPPMGGRAPEGG